MFEIILYLFESYIQIEQTIELTADQITDELLEEGFHQEEISKALVWLDKLATLHETNEQNRPLNAQKTSLRIYSHSEQLLLDTKCQGYICYLEQANILNTYSREVLIDCAMSLEINSLSLHDLKWLALMVLYNDPDSEDEFLQLESMILDFEEGLIH